MAGNPGIFAAMYCVLMERANSSHFNYVLVHDSAFLHQTSQVWGQNEMQHEIAEHFSAMVNAPHANNLDNFPEYISEPIKDNMFFYCVPCTWLCEQNNFSRVWDELSSVCKQF